jgi:hypothetical protein
LGDGQQLACFGTHPETRQLYRWHGGEPGQIKLEDLPYISEEETQALVNDVVGILTRDFGYTRAAERPKARRANGQAEPAGAEDWQYLINNIFDGNALHDSLRDLAAKLIRSGTSAGAAVNQLRALMESSAAPHDERWRERYREIPRLVDGATEKYAKAPEAKAAPVGPPSTVAQTLAKFEQWLLLKDQTPVLAVLGAIAANYLEGDPVWLGGCTAKLGEDGNPQRAVDAAGCRTVRNRDAGGPAQRNPEKAARQVRQGRTAAANR